MTNGGFENPSVGPAGRLPVGEIPGWTSLGPAELEHAAAMAAAEGTQCLELLPGAKIGQDCRTLPGGLHALTLLHAAAPDAQAVSLEVWFGGALLDTIPSVPAAGWRRYRRNLSAGTDLERLELRAVGSGPAGILVDDVGLMPYDPTVRDERIRNGNFEEDPRIEPGTSFSTGAYIGWTSLDAHTIEVHDLGEGLGGRGKNVVDLDEGRSIGQRVHVVPGTDYALRFSFSPNPSDDRPRRFEVSFAGRVVETLDVPSSPSLLWTTRTHSVRSDEPVALLAFRDLSGGLDGALIDGVSLTGIGPPPETTGQVASHHLLAADPQAGLHLGTGDMFARGVTSLGDLDGDGVQDLAVGAVGDDDGANMAGAVWILFLRPDFTLRAATRISENSGGLGVDLAADDGFGRAVTGLGDLDGDGIPDLAVGANLDDSGGIDSGAVYVLLLERDGTVRNRHEISAASGDPLERRPRPADEFGSSVAGMGDLDGDGIPDLVIGARMADSVQVCFMNRDGTVRASRNVTFGTAGFTDQRSWAFDLLGMSVANMGDFDEDGVNDLLVGAYGRRHETQGFVGGQYLWLMEPDGRVKEWFFYGSPNLNPRTQTLGLWYNLGGACAGPGDVDGDGVRDIVSGASRDGWISGIERYEGEKSGAAYVILLNRSGSVKACQRLGDHAGGFDYDLPSETRWGESLCALGDHDGDGLVDVAIGSRFLFQTGALFLCELRGRSDAPPVPVHADFAVDRSTGPAPLTVAFTDLSTGDVTSHVWDFGDGTGSTEASPTHAYLTPGTHDVALTVRTADGREDTRTVVGLMTVTEEPLPPGVVRLGCGINPPGSLVVVSGAPSLGSTLVLGVDNPFGSQSPGALAQVVVSLRGHEALPCGTPVPGQGMVGPFGEWLLGEPTFLTRSGATWQGPGLPAEVAFRIPNRAGLVGRTFYVQGRLVDSPDSPLPIGLADGFALTIGP